MRNPFSAAAACNCIASSTDGARGFSEWTCFPARTTCRLTSAWALGTVKLSMISMSRFLRTSSMLTEGILNSALRAFAFAGSMSEMARISRMGKYFAADKYCELTLPQPMMPTPTRFKLVPLTGIAGSKRADAYAAAAMPLYNAMKSIECRGQRNYNRQQPAVQNNDCHASMG
jgi:hypothetical protein